MNHRDSSMAARPNHSPATVHRPKARPTTRAMTSHTRPSAPNSRRCHRRRAGRPPGGRAPFGVATRPPYAGPGGRLDDTAGPVGRLDDTAGPGGRLDDTAGPGGRLDDTAGPGGRLDRPAGPR